MEPRFKTIGETARRFKRSEQTVRNYCDAGLLPSVRVGGNNERLIPENAVEEFALNLAEETTKRKKRK